MATGGGYEITMIRSWGLNLSLFTHVHKHSNFSHPIFIIIIVSGCTRAACVPEPRD